MNAIEAQQALQEADLLHSEAEVSAALDRLASQINNYFQEKDPIVFCVMKGAVIPTGMLVSRFDFPFRLDYLHHFYGVFNNLLFSSVDPIKLI